MQCIADANVLLPLLTEGHAHRQPALTWWEACDDRVVGLCLPVRMALLRLLRIRVSWVPELCARFRPGTHSPS